MIASIVSTAIFVICLALIFSEKLNRVIVALLGAVVMVVVGMLMGFFSEDAAMAAIDLNTLGLLLGMMILVALLEPTGFFQFLAIWVAKLSRGRPVRLLVMLGVVTTVISMFLDNVTTVVLIAPVTILISELIGINPQALLLAEALLSDTGGVATLVGDPPNVLIASAANLSFMDFLQNSFPIVIVVWLVALLLIRYLFRKELATAPTNTEAIAQLRPEEVLEDRTSATRVLIVTALAIVFFLLEEQLHVRPALIALGAAAVSLAWVRPNVHETLRRVEWDVLVFFGALFVIVGGMESAGVLHQLAQVIVRAADLPPILLGIAVIWVVALLSAIVDNIPITIAMIPVIMELGAAGINITPLWWALAFGAGFGGNGTIIGSTANVVVVSLSERTRFPITPRLWSKRGLPVMLATCATASVLYALAYPLLAR
ncbi:MAG TPA: SLC13 family permease [Anaerolineaceae bacterium]|nr:SLC13 family permease [Anaerolineaceae bacterium]